MDPFFDEKAADHEVIRSLLKALNRSHSMSKLFLDEKGILHVAKEVEQITVEEAQKLYEEFTSKIVVLKSFLSKESGGTLTDTTQVTPGAPAQAPADATPATPAEQNPAPTDPTVPAAPADPSQVPPAAPVDPSQQVPAPTVEQPAAPAADPNIQPAPATDPNAAPVQTTQPDPNAIHSIQ